MEMSSYSMPTTVEDALRAAVSAEGDCQYVAGGTDAQVLRRQNLNTPPHVIDLSGISRLRHIERKNEGVILGSLVSLHELATSAVIADQHPLIAMAAESIATPVIRRTATIGGNLLVSNRCTYFNQSEFWRGAIGSCLRDAGDTCLVTGVQNGQCFSRHVSDMAPALIALSAEVTITALRGETTLPLADLYVQDGLRPVRHLDGMAILTSIRVPRPVSRWGFRKLRLRDSLDFTSLTAAATLDDKDSVRMCFNGVAMSPILIEGQMSEMSTSDILRQVRLKSKIVGNDHVLLKHRKDMLNVYVEELWNELKTTEASR